MIASWEGFRIPNTFRISKDLNTGCFEIPWNLVKKKLSELRHLFEGPVI